MNIQDFSPTQYIEFDTEYPSISSTAESEIGKPGALAELFVGGELYMLDIDPLTGRFSWTAPAAFLDGSYIVSLRFIDNTGNFGDPLLITMVIDTTPPEAPDLIEIYDDFGAIRVGLRSGDITDDKRPTLTGIAQKGTTVYLLNDNGEKIGSAVADKITGKWVMDPSQDLAEGNNNLRLVAEEFFAGKIRTGIASEPFTLIIESNTLPPSTITITDAYDDAGSFTGPLSNGALTDDTTPTLRGTASAGSTVIVYYRMAGAENWLGSASATVTGESWSWTPGSELPFGSYEFMASAGSFNSEFLTLDIASEADIILRTRIESVQDDFGSATGFLGNGAITDDGTPTFRGTAEANSKVVLRYTLNGNIATVIVDADSAGRWNWTPDVNLAAGLWSFEVQALGQSSWGETFTLSIVSSAHGFSPIIDYAIDDTGPVNVDLRSGNTTDDNTPTLHGHAEANSLVYILTQHRSGEIIYSVKADNYGKWQWTPAEALKNGEWHFQVSTTTGNNWSSRFDLNINGTTGDGEYGFDFETLPPSEKVIYDNSVQETFSYPNDVQMSVYFLRPFNSTWTSNFVDPESYFLKDGSFGSQALRLTPQGTVAFSNKNAFQDFSFELFHNHSAYDFKITIEVITLKDAKKHTITKSLKAYEVYKINLDTLFNLNLSADDGFGYISIKNIEGNGLPDHILLDNFSFNSAADNITLSHALDDDGTFTGLLSNGALTGDDTPTLTGTVAKTYNVLVYWRLAGSEGWEHSATASVSNGSWRWTPDSGLPPGTYEFQASIGKFSSALFSLDIASAEELDLRTRIDNATDDAGTVTGLLNSNAITDDLRPTLRGTAEANSKVILRYTLDSNVATAIVDVDSAGNWNWTPDSNLMPGQWSFEIQTPGQSKWKEAFILNILSNGQVFAPVIDYAVSDAGPTNIDLSNGNSTDDKMPTLHGHAEANSLVYIRTFHNSAEKIYSVTTDSESKWQWVPTKELQEGDWNFQVSSISSGNWGSSFNLNIDKFTHDFDFETLPPTQITVNSDGSASEKVELSDQVIASIYIPPYMTSSPSKSNFIDPTTINMNEGDLGRQALRIWANGSAHFARKPGNDTFAFRDFAFDIYQSYGVTATFKISVTTMKYSRTYTETISLAPKKITKIQLNEIFKINFEDGDGFRNITLGGAKDGGSPQILIDNIEFNNAADLVANSLQWLEDASLHQLAGVEELAATSIAGKENQIDTLQITGKDQVLDLTAVADKIESIEIFDITGSGDNTLRLDLNALLQHGEKDLFIEDGKTQLMVKGDEGDVVQIKDILPEGDDISEWKHQDGTVTVGGVEYEVYSHGDDAELLVQHGVKTELV
jgi:uncharacterized protein YndB with AHSA1/START domain